MSILRVVEKGGADEYMEIPAGNERWQIVDGGDHSGQDLR